MGTKFSLAKSVRALQSATCATGFGLSASLASLLNPEAKDFRVISPWGRDQLYYDAFLPAHLLTSHEVIQDNSLRDSIYSEDSEYIMRRIREEYITGSSCTIVLCGLETPWRKFVDWEIKATLDAEHGLIGVWLPTVPLQSNGGTDKAPRLQDNIDSGYAVWTSWTAITSNPVSLATVIEDANGRSKLLTRNSRAMMTRNGTPAMAYLSFAEARALAPRMEWQFERRNYVQAKATATPLGSVFLSHSSQDDESIPGVVEFLKQFGVAVFVDNYDERLPNPPSIETAKIIKDEIGKSERLLVLVSPNSRSSRWIPWELGLADALKGIVNVGILPITPDGYEEAWTKEEYFALYPRVYNSYGAWYVLDPRDGKPWGLRAWITGFR